MGLLLPDALIATGNPVLFALFGTCFTWFVTALGAATVFLVPENLPEETEGKFLDACLGFAAGVMLAASYWSLLAPAIELAEESNYGSLSFLPAAVGFSFGAVFVFLADYMLPESADDPLSFMEPVSDNKKVDPSSSSSTSSSNVKQPSDNSGLRRRNINSRTDSEEGLGEEEIVAQEYERKQKKKSWRRLILLVLAVTIHNFPEGLAVGTGFGAIGTAEKATIQAAEVLTYGIGIQNFPEGLAVSLPMRRMGYSKYWCFFYGQLSGMVEPFGGYLGAALVHWVEQILPFALAFAAGAMVYVVVDSIVPEAQVRGNGTVSTWGCIAGFIIMMALDVALG